VPWCSACDRFLNPNTVTTDGTCPTCGRTVEAADAPRARRPEGRAEVDGQAAGDLATVDADEGVRAPWHFWVMVVGGVA